MTQPLSAPAALAADRPLAAPDRPDPVSPPSPSGPAGGYAAISIGRWWQGGKSSASR